MWPYFRPCLRIQETGFGGAGFSRVSSGVIVRTPWPGQSTSTHFPAHKLTEKQDYRVQGSGVSVQGSEVSVRIFVQTPSASANLPTLTLRHTDSPAGDNAVN